MAYQGYLVKIGTYIVPFEWIVAKTFKQTLYGQDLGSYNDANGHLQRDALEERVPKVEWNTPECSDSTFENLMSNIRANYTNTTEKKVSATVWVQELNSYVTQEMYLADVSFTINYADEHEVQYDKVRLGFIGYGGKV